MVPNFKLEKALAVLVFLTLVAIIGERWILETELVLDVTSPYGTAVYDDDVEGGNSVAALVQNTNAYEWRCTLKDQYSYPFCGFELIFDPTRQSGLDLTRYDRIRLLLEYKGTARTLRMYLRNFDSAYSTPSINDSTKYNQVEFDTSLTTQPVEFALADFFVANWWAQRYRVPPQLSHPQFDNIVVLEVATGNASNLGEHRFRLHRVELTGQILSTVQWYQLIMAVWLVIALVFLGVRILHLNQEVSRRRQREKELVEVNALLDARGKELEEMAKTDPLTGAFNREGIKEAIKAGLAEWRWARKPMSVVMLDIDYFKRINDTYGHAIGDQILTQLSELVHSNIRGSDLFARWGGEEFVLVCRNTPAADCARLAEKLRQLVASHQFAQSIKVTVSIGVATLHEHESLDQLFERADRALYAAKGGGRDRVMMADQAA